jgi:hypothetical protein
MNTEKVRDEIILIEKHRLNRCRELVSLALEQREILTERRHSELEDNASKHENVIAEVAKLDRRKESLLQELDRQQTGSSAPVDFEKRRSAILAETAGEAKKLKSIMEVNAGLLSNAMNYVSFTMGLMARLATVQPSYDPRSESSLSSAIVLDLKV